MRLMSNSNDKPQSDNFTKAPRKPRSPNKSKQIDEQAPNSGVTPSSVAASSPNLELLNTKDKLKKQVV